jgi:hypothetical protein
MLTIFRRALNDAPENKGDQIVSTYCTESFGRYRQSFELFEDCFGGFGPDEWLG